MLGPEWRKSTRSASGTGCVEARLGAGGVQIRDSKNPEGGTLSVGVNDWRAFLASVKAGRLEVPA